MANLDEDVAGRNGERLPLDFDPILERLPNGLLLTRARNAFTTPTSTSASSRLSRTSRRAGSTFAAVSSVRPASLLRAWRNPLVSVSNMSMTLLAQELENRCSGRSAYAAVVHVWNEDSL